ncbi:indole-3-glycerol phosphate synthase [Natranaerovirga hydrolytica]|uniref:Indole-3-glycerol phosphate synthase n=1 Tax=Natranaerovirga hydrolytica TaxID=680378 RepID=A0A4R1N2J4_9FIRM|nr:indole-3-glycerol phosphate synthase TrpC [Natranaerovirga hydrolytica]TCK98224.1 indole-3-glycerol phosphate synthase [Natranaerovirga hydrolytica]
MILDEIIGKKKIRLEAVKKAKPLELIKEKAIAMEMDLENTFYHAISQQGLSVIGEIKKASPSTGDLDVMLSLDQRINQYDQSVDAISVLTEEDYFKGSVEIFKEVRHKTQKPLLRKDFIIDAYQIYEAKVIGADAILLIATALKEDDLIMLCALARTLNLEVLMEVHNKEDLEKALKTNARIIGINNRNLKDFSIDLTTTRELVPFIPSDRLVISESGIKDEKDISDLKEIKVDGILVGRTLMEMEHPKQTVKEWKQYFDS